MRKTNQSCPLRQMRILVAEDVEDYSGPIAEALSNQGAEVTLKATPESIRSAIMNEPFDIVLLDLDLTESGSHTDGMEILKYFNSQRGGGRKRFAQLKSPPPVFIIVSIFDHVNIFKEALELGAQGYVPKTASTGLRRDGEDLGEAVCLEVQQVLSNLRCRQENVSLHRAISHQMIYQSASMRKIVKEIESIAKHGVNALISGERGVGKELVARSIRHRRELLGKKSIPFFPIDCASVPKELMSSELCGHEEGAFTGAIGKKLGIFEQSDGGIAFLDEIGELTYESQAKFLRFLSEGEFKRVGGGKIISANVQTIAATNRKTLRLELKDRFDAKIFLPPLRERKEDIPLIFEHHVNLLAVRFNYDIIPRIDPLVMERLIEYDWPGNARSVSNLANEVVRVDSDDFIDLDDVSPLLEALKASDASDASDASKNRPSGDSSESPSDPISALTTELRSLLVKPHRKTLRRFKDCNERMRKRASEILHELRDEHRLDWNTIIEKVGSGSRQSLIRFYDFETCASPKHTPSAVEV